jgi:ATP-binding cassette subfamily B protein
VISGIQHFLLQRTGTAVVYSSRRRLVAQLLHLPVQEYDARRTGDLVSRVGTDTTLLYAVLTQGLADSIGNALIFVGAVVAMLVIDPVLLLLILVVVGASVAVVGALSGRIRRATAVQQERVGELASGVERAVGSIRTIRAAGAATRAGRIERRRAAPTTPACRSRRRRRSSCRSPASPCSCRCSSSSVWAGSASPPARSRSRSS